MKPVTMALVAVAWLLTSCSPVPVNEAKARKLAVETFDMVCQDWSYTSSMFIGPTRTKVAGAAFAFEWSPRGANGHKILISVTHDGRTQVEPTDWFQSQ